MITDSEILTYLNTIKGMIVYMNEEQKEMTKTHAKKILEMLEEIK